MDALIPIALACLSALVGINLYIQGTQRSFTKEVKEDLTKDIGKLEIEVGHIHQCLHETKDRVTVVETKLGAFK